MSIDLEEFRRLIQGKTPGPWVGFMDTVQQSTSFESPVRVCYVPGDTFATVDPDRSFITYCGTHAESLLAELEALRKVAEVTITAEATLHDNCGGCNRCSIIYQDMRESIKAWRALRDGEAKP